MHYYSRNLGDYYKKAGRLSMLQHGAYTLLIDSCYDREQFPTLDLAIEWTWASSTEEIEAVKFVLSKFFILSDGVYTQNRIAEDIEKYKAKAETNKRIAIEREAKRKLAREKKSNEEKLKKERENMARDENSTNRANDYTNCEQGVHDSPPNQEPITNNQEPITNIKDIKDLSPKVDDSQNKPVNQVFEVYKFWCDTMKKSTARTALSKKRQKVITDRLKRLFD